MPGAPSGHERARYGCVGQIDRDCIIDDATRAARGHCPAIGASILVEPRLHLIEPLAEAAGRYRQPDPHRKTALGLDNHKFRACGHAISLPVAALAGERMSRPVISTLPSPVSCRLRSFRSTANSNRVRWRWYASRQRSGVIPPSIKRRKTWRGTRTTPSYSDADSELDRWTVLVPAGVLREAEKHAAVSG